MENNIPITKKVLYHMLLKFALTLYLADTLIKTNKLDQG